MLTLAACAGSSAGAPEDITGVWSVTMRATDGSCPDTKGVTRAATWTASRRQDGLFDVAVQGGEAPSQLQGEIVDGHIEVKTVDDAFEAWVTVWRLTGSASQLQGTAIEPRKIETGATRQLGKVAFAKKLVCATWWEVVATRQ